MNNLIKKFFSGINAIKRKSGTYKKITTEELVSRFTKENLDYVDLSELDLSNFGDFFTSHPTGPFSHTGAHGWTENVIWPTPNKMPKGFNPQTYIDSHKHPQEIDQLNKITGRGINIAIIDSMFNPNHPEYKDNIKYFQGPLMKMRSDSTHYHSSMVVGCAVGKTTGTAPKASVYYFTRAKNNNEASMEIIAVLKSVLEFNKKQSKQNKINILSCSWNPARFVTNDKEYTEIMNLFDEIEAQGIKIILCGGDDLDKFKPSFSVSKRDFVPTSLDTHSTEYNETIKIPTNEKTVPYNTGGYLYQKIGGDSSSAPYLAGVYACALQDNKIFMTRPNWQQELNTILQQTATPIKSGEKIINPLGIREQVTKIAREMEINLIKQKSTEHE